MEGNKLNIPKKPTGLLYIDRNRAFFYEPNLSSPLSTAFPPDALSDLEVVNKKKLEATIETFVKTNKLQPKSIVILLSTQTTFDKDFARNSVEVEKNMGEFLELVPFEDSVSKKTMFPNKLKVVAANRELCDAIRIGFQNVGFAVTGVYPLTFFLEVMPQLQSNLDLGVVMSKVAEAHDFNLIPVIESPVSSTAQEKPTKTRLYALIGVFGLLVLILLFFVYRNIIAPPKTPPALPMPSLAPAALAPAVEESSTSGEIQSTSPSIFPSASPQNPSVNQ